MEQPILIAIVSAASALGGVLLAQSVAMLQSWLERKHKRQILLRTKYEEMAMYFLDSMKMPAGLILSKSDEEILSFTQQTSANKSHALCLLYFPRLCEASGRYIASYATLIEISASLYDPTSEKPLGAQVFDKPQYQAASNAHLAARDHFQDQIQTHSNVYAIA